MGGEVFFLATSGTDSLFTVVVVGQLRFPATTVGGKKKSERKPKAGSKGEKNKTQRKLFLASLGTTASKESFPKCS